MTRKSAGEQHAQNSDSLSPSELFPYQPNRARWRYVQQLGQGSYGICWKAVDMSSVHRDFVVIKVSLYQRGSAQGFMLHREAMSSIQHIHCESSSGYDASKAALFVKYYEDHTAFKNLDSEKRRRYQLDPLFIDWNHAKITDPDELYGDDFDYVVMQFCEGESLRNLIHDRVFTARSNRRVLVDCCTALQYLSELEPPLIHRDFRPANLLWDGQRVTVLDFGLMLPYEKQLSTSSSVVNAVNADKTTYWVPPEVRNRNLNFGYKDARRSWTFDMFSLATIMAELCIANDAKFSNRSEDFVYEVESYWRALGVWFSGYPEFLKFLFREDYDNRPSPKEVARWIHPREETVAFTLFEEGYKHRIDLAEQKALSAAGALQFLERGSEESCLEKIINWINQGGLRTWKITCRRLEVIARDAKVTDILDYFCRKTKSKNILSLLGATREKVQHITYPIQKTVDFAPRKILRRQTTGASVRKGGDLLFTPPLSSTQSSEPRPMPSGSSQPSHMHKSLRHGGKMLFTSVYKPNTSPQPTTVLRRVISDCPPIRVEGVLVRPRRNRFPLTAQEEKARLGAERLFQSAELSVSATPNPKKRSLDDGGGSIFKNLAKPPNRCEEESLTGISTRAPSMLSRLESSTDMSMNTMPSMNTMSTRASSTLSAAPLKRRTLGLVKHVKNSNSKAPVRSKASGSRSKAKSLCSKTPGCRRSPTPSFRIVLTPHV